MTAESDLKKKPWLAEGETKRTVVKDMFADLAPGYDRANRVMSLNFDLKWRRLAVSKLGLKPGDSALDLCTGTGDFMVPLRKAVGEAGRLLGLDFCEPMVQLAQKKRISAQFGLGDALALPVRSNAVEAVTVGWGIRNVSDIDSAHREIFRVLKPGGRFVSIDMAQPRGTVMRTAARVVLGIALPVLGRLIGRPEGYAYLQQSTLAFWDRERLADSMHRAGFTQVEWHDLMLGAVCMHWGEKPR